MPTRSQAEASTAIQKIGQGKSASEMFEWVATASIASTRSSW